MRFSVSALSPLLAAIFLAGSALAAPLPEAPEHFPHAILARAPVPPAEDPFYAKPTDKAFTKKPAGSVIRQRSVTPAQFTLLPENLASAEQVIYKTIDLQGRPEVNALTVLMPKKLNLNSEGLPKTLIYQVAEDSPNSVCAPSIQLQQGGSGNVEVQLESLFINAALAKNWIVVVPDYEGPHSAFTVGKLSGTGVLDAARATLRLRSIVEPSRAKRLPLALMGYSGGALASGWALQEQKSYAPELSSNLIAAALGGLPVNVEDILLKLNGGPTAGLIVSGLAGQYNVRPDIQQFFTDHLNADGFSRLRAANGTCLPQIITANVGVDFISKFDMTKEQLLADPVVRRTLDESFLGRNAGVLPVPVFAYHATMDDIVGTEYADKYYADQISRGATITYDREIVSEHLVAFVTGSGSAFQYLEARFAGTAAPRSSTQTRALNLLQQSAVEQLGPTVLAQAQALLGIPGGFAGLFPSR